MIFIDWRTFLDRLGSSDPPGSNARRALALLLAGQAVLWAWMFLPIPPNVGALLFLNKVMPQRLVYASGLMLLSLSLFMFKIAGARCSLGRFILLTNSVLCVWLYWKGGPTLSPRVALSDNGYRDILIVPLVAAAGVWAHFWRTRPTGAIILACAVVNIIGFGWINPLQSAGPIFAQHRSPLLTSLQDLQEHDTRDWLVTPVGFGAILNGLGFRSVSAPFRSPLASHFSGHIFPICRPSSSTSSSTGMPISALRRCMSRLCPLVTPLSCQSTVSF